MDKIKDYDKADIQERLLFERRIRITIMKIGAGRVTLQMVDTDKIHNSSATGTMYNEEAGETYARVDAEYCHTTTTWNVVASGTWITT